MKSRSPSVVGLAGEASSRRTLAAAFIAAVLSVMPTFLLGGVAVLVRADLGFSESRLGLCIAAYYIVSMVSAVPGGHLAERLGGLRACSVGILLSAGTLLSVAVLARQWWQLVACLAAGGLANALLQPATNLALARGIPTDRQGLAFGLKLANGPTATLLAGLSAALIATTVGWRWAFVTLACLALVFFVVRPPGWRSEAPYVASAGDGPDAAVATLALIAVGCAFATTAGASLVGFYVESAVAGGLSVSAAGFMLVAGSVVGTVARGAWGWLVDRRHRRVRASGSEPAGGDGGVRASGSEPAGGDQSGFGLTVLLLVVGGLAFLLLGVRAGPVVLLVATMLAFAAGWGWPGLLLFAVVRASPSTPGRATGIVIVGTSSGGVVGPAVFGFLVEHAGYAVAWRAAAVAVLLAAACIGGGAHLLRRRDRTIAPA